MFIQIFLMIIDESYFIYLFFFTLYLINISWAIGIRMQMLHNIWESKSISNSISITVTEYSDQRNIGKIVSSKFLFRTIPAAKSRWQERESESHITSLEKLMHVWIFALS